MRALGAVCVCVCVLFVHEVKKVNGEMACTCEHAHKCAVCVLCVVYVLTTHKKVAMRVMENPQGRKWRKNFIGVWWRRDVDHISGASLLLAAAVCVSPSLHSPMHSCVAHKHHHHCGITHMRT